MSRLKGYPEYIFCNDHDDASDISDDRNFSNFQPDDSCPGSGEVEGERLLSSYMKRSAKIGGSDDGDVDDKSGDRERRQSMCSTRTRKYSNRDENLNRGYSYPPHPPPAALPRPVNYHNIHNRHRWEPSMLNTPRKYNYEYANFGHQHRIDYNDHNYPGRGRGPSPFHHHHPYPANYKRKFESPPANQPDFEHRVQVDVGFDQYGRSTKRARRCSDDHSPPLPLPLREDTYQRPTRRNPQDHFHRHYSYPPPTHDHERRLRPLEGTRTRRRTDRDDEHFDDDRTRNRHETFDAWHNNHHYVESRNDNGSTTTTRRQYSYHNHQRNYHNNSLPPAPTRTSHPASKPSFIWLHRNRSRRHEHSNKRKREVSSTSSINRSGGGDDDCGDGHGGRSELQSIHSGIEGRGRRGESRRRAQWFRPPSFKRRRGDSHCHSHSHSYARHQQPNIHDRNAYRDYNDRRQHHHDHHHRRLDERDGNHDNQRFPERNFGKRRRIE